MEDHKAVVNQMNRCLISSIDKDNSRTADEDMDLKEDLRRQIR